MSICAGPSLARGDDGLAAAHARIEQHRKGDFTVAVVDAAGRPVADAPVTVRMTRHAFAFGSCFRADRLAKTEADHPYEVWGRKLFNRGTLGNSLKWRWQEKPEARAKADAAVRWMRDAGMTVHAHVMIWATLKYGPPMPKDVVARLKGDDPDRADWLRRRTLEHIRTVGRRYRGQVEEWDVINEHFSEHEITKVVHPDAPLEQPPLLVDWLRAAREADPDAVLYINDFGILVGDQTKHKDSYEKLIRYLLDQGAPLGGIGFQGHYVNGWQRRTPGQLMQTLDRFARFGLDLQVTEFDMWGKGWGDTPEQVEQNQAAYLRRFYTVCFSHPAITGITMWGFWDGQHWMKNAPLFRRDWTAKPGLAVYQDLVFNQWWTHTGGRTDPAGRFVFRGFRGDYRVTVGDPASPQVEQAAAWPDARGEVTVRLPGP